MTDRIRFVEDIVLALVREYGAEPVATALDRAASFVSTHGRQQMSRSGSSAVSASSSKKKITAVEIVERRKVPYERKMLLTHIADRFDQKAFLPSAADVRDFIIMSGDRPRAAKNRSDVFPQILSIIEKLPIGRLQDVAHRASHNGPTDLAVISDAISAAGEQRRKTLFPEDAADKSDGNR